MVAISLDLDGMQAEGFTIDFGCPRCNTVLETDNGQGGSISTDCTARLWEVSTGKELCRRIAGEWGAIRIFLPRRATKTYRVERTR